MYDFILQASPSPTRVSLLTCLRCPDLRGPAVKTAVDTFAAKKGLKVYVEDGDVAMKTWLMVV